MKPAQIPIFGPDNMLNCQPENIIAYPLNGSISQKGLIIAMDFYPIDQSTTYQTIFSIRDLSDNFISLRLDYYVSLQSLQFIL